jgi:hypothetical protein
MRLETSLILDKSNTYEVIHMPTISDNIKLVTEFSALYSSILKRLESQLSIHGISFTEFLVMHQLSAAPAKPLKKKQLSNFLELVVALK